jgi:hypothetical protein
LALPPPSLAHGFLYFYPFCQTFNLEIHGLLYHISVTRHGNTKVKMLRDPVGQGYRLLDAVKGAQIHQRRNVKLIGTAVVAIVLLMVTASFLYDRPPASPAAWELPPTTNAQDVLPRTKIALCDNFDRKGVARLLEAEKRYQNLRDDKFT